MTAKDYEDLRRARPGLKLPPWRWLRKQHQRKAGRMNGREVIAGRMATLLGRSQLDGDRIMGEVRVRASHLWLIAYRDSTRLLKRMETPIFLSVWGRASDNRMLSCL